MHRGASHKSTDFALMIKITNMKGFWAFLQDIRIISIFTYIKYII